MIFAHDTETALVAAAALVNTGPAASHTGDDELATVETGKLAKPPPLFRQETKQNKKKKKNELLNPSFWNWRVVV